MYERSRFAVCISIGQGDDGQLRLVIDDVERNGAEPPQWRHFTFVTNAPITAADLAQMRFTDEQFTEFGRLVLGAIAVHAPPP